MHSFLLLVLLFVSMGALASAQMCPQYGQCSIARQTLMGNFIRALQPYGSTVPVDTVTSQFHAFTTVGITAVFGMNGEMLVSQCVQQGATVFNSAYMIKNCSCIPDCSTAGVLDSWIGNANRASRLN